MIPFAVERLVRAPLPDITTQRVDLVMGSANGQIQVTSVDCRLAAHFDDLVAATVSSRHHPNMHPAAIARTPGWRKIRPGLRYLRSLASSGPGEGEGGRLLLDARHVRPNNIAHAMNHLIPSALAAEALSGE